MPKGGPYSDKPIKKVYYSISEVAGMFTREAGQFAGNQVTTATLRFWEDIFPFLNPKKNGKGVRYYTDRDIARVEFIVKHINRGISLQAIRHEWETKSTQYIIELERVIVKNFEHNMTEPNEPAITEHMPPNIKKEYLRIYNERIKWYKEAEKLFNKYEGNKG